MEQTKALLLAGGLGTRLRPLTDSLPKCLVPIAGRPLLDHWVERLAASGIVEGRVNTHAHAEQVRCYLEGVNRSGRVLLTESHEPQLLGSAGTVAANADLAAGAEAVVLIYADNFSDVDLSAMLDFHRSHSDPATMLLFRAPDPRACGIAELDDDRRVVSFVEKPKAPRGNLANAGVYVFDADLYREVAALRAFDLGFDVLPRLVGRMRGWAWDGYHRDIGTHEVLQAVRREAPAVLAGRGTASRALRPAVFLDRDGTLIEDVHYLSDPARVRLLPSVGQALRRLGQAGFARVVVTNQSPVGRGRLTVSTLDRIHDELCRQLAEEGVTLEGIDYCPIAPNGDDRTAIEHFDRKPGPGMLVRSAGRLGLDLTASWMIGDTIRDVLAGVHAGCRGCILVRTGQGLSDAEAQLPIDYLIADNLNAAVDSIMASRLVDAMPGEVA